MICEIVCSSRTGNTAAVAGAVKEAAAAAGFVCRSAAGPEEACREADLICVGFWTDKGDCSRDAAAYLESLRGKKIFLFGTAGFGGSPDYFEKVLGRVRAHLDPSNLVLGTFMCQGRMPQAVRDRFEAGLKQNPEDTGLKNRVENFDRALSHPDQEDFRAARRAAEAALAAVKGEQESRKRS